MPQTYLFEACALLHGSRSQTLESHAEALMRCLHEALGQRAKLHGPGVAEMSFDERWLVQLGTAAAQDDTLSLRFLLESRVAREHQRLVTFLIRQIAECFEL